MRCTYWRDLIRRGGCNHHLWYLNGHSSIVFLHGTCGVSSWQFLIQIDPWSHETYPYSYHENSRDLYGQVRLYTSDVWKTSYGWSWFSPCPALRPFVSRWTLDGQVGPPKLFASSKRFRLQKEPVLARWCFGSDWHQRMLSRKGEVFLRQFNIWHYPPVI